MKDGSTSPEDRQGDPAARAVSAPGSETAAHAPAAAAPIPVRMGRELWEFIRRPRRVIARRLQHPNHPVGLWTVLMGSAAAVIVTWGLYGLAFGSLVDKLGFATQPSSPPAEVEAEGGTVGEPTDVEPGEAPSESVPQGTTSNAAQSPDKPAIRVTDWGWTPGVAVSLTLPSEGRVDLDQPQRVRFTFGTVFLEIDGIVPKTLLKGSFPLVLQGLYAVLLLLCLFPPARLLGSHTDLRSAWVASAVFCGYAVLAGNLVVLAGALLLLDLLSLQGIALALAWSVMQLSVLVLIVRAYFTGFSEGYGLPVWKIGVSSVGAVLLSALVAPLVFVPGVYLLLRFQSVLDLFL